MSESSVIHETPESRPPTGPVGRWLTRVTLWLALAGGLLMVATMLSTLASILGRALFNTPVPGDYELVELGIGMAVFSFLPYTQIVRGNIVVELITGAMGPRGRAILDLIGDLVLAGLAALMAWRVTVGALGEIEFGITTMRLGIPMGIPMGFAAFSLALLCLCALYTGWRDGRRVWSRADG